MFARNILLVVFIISGKFLLASLVCAFFVMNMVIKTAVVIGAISTTLSLVLAQAKHEENKER